MHCIKLKAENCILKTVKHLYITYFKIIRKFYKNFRPRCKIYDIFEQKTIRIK